MLRALRATVLCLCLAALSGCRQPAPIIERGPELVPATADLAALARYHPAWNQLLRLRSRLADLDVAMGELPFEAPVPPIEPGALAPEPSAVAHPDARTDAAVEAIERRAGDLVGIVERSAQPGPKVGGSESPAQGRHGAPGQSPSAGRLQRDSDALAAEAERAAAALRDRRSRLLDAGASRLGPRAADATPGTLERVERLMEQETRAAAARLRSAWTAGDGPAGVESAYEPSPRAQPPNSAPTNARALARGRLDELEREIAREEERVRSFLAGARVPRATELGPPEEPSAAEPESEAPWPTLDGAAGSVAELRARYESLSEAVLRQTYEVAKTVARTLGYDITADGSGYDCTAELASRLAEFFGSELADEGGGYTG